MAKFVQTEDEIPEKLIFITFNDPIYLTKIGSSSAEMYLPSRKNMKHRLPSPF